MTAAREAAEITIATAAPKATIVGLSAMGAGWLTLDSAVTLIGAAITILAGWATWYYKRRASARADERNERDRELHALRVQWLRDRIASPATHISPAQSLEAKALGVDVRATDINEDDDA